jgi:hypothetical protein
MIAFFLRASNGIPVKEPKGKIDNLRQYLFDFTCRITGLQDKSRPFRNIDAWVCGMHAREGRHPELRGNAVAKGPAGRSKPSRRKGRACYQDIRSRFLDPGKNGIFEILEIFRGIIVTANDGTDDF